MWIRIDEIRTKGNEQYLKQIDEAMDFLRDSLID